MNSALTSNGSTSTERWDSTKPFDGLDDLRLGLSRYRLWWALSVGDIRGRYRRSVLGPWWVVIGNAIALVGMGIVWSTIFDAPMQQFFPYLVAGFIVWAIWSAFLIEGCQTFTAAYAVSVLKNLNTAKSTHAFRLATRVIFLFAHNVVTYLGVAIYYGVPVTASTLLVFPALAVTWINGVWLSLLLGMAAARYRDLEPLIIALMMFLFLLTPIMWQIDQLGERGYVAYFNPLTHFVEIMRAPMLGHAPSLASWEIVGAITAAGIALGFLAFQRYGRQLVFWL